MSNDGILAKQVEYYRLRASEYDATAYTDLAELAERIDRIVADLAPSGSILELACGTGMWTRALAAYNRAENSHQPFRRREGAMAKFRDVKTLQKFAAVHVSIHNHFNHNRHLSRRDIFKQHRSAALAEWRQLAA